MLDVHPPEHAAHSWRDFFIHIATIVVGLLIAVGLEQTVEYVHRRHEVNDTRAALAQERAENRKFHTVNVAEYRAITGELENNLRVLLFLREHPGTPEEKLPGVLVWNASYEPEIQSVWNNSQQSQVLTLFPRTEAEDYRSLYDLLDGAEQGFLTMHDALGDARAYAIADPDPSHMTPPQLDTEITLTQKAIGRAEKWGVYLDTIHSSHPDFTASLTLAEVMGLYHSPRALEDEKKLAVATAITDADLASVRAARSSALKAVGDTH